MPFLWEALGKANTTHIIKELGNWWVNFKAAGIQMPRLRPRLRADTALDVLHAPRSVWARCARSVVRAVVVVHAAVEYSHNLGDIVVVGARERECSPSVAGPGGGVSIAGGSGSVSCVWGGVVGSVGQQTVMGGEGLGGKGREAGR
jgi:hypothetical protein